MTNICEVYVLVFFIYYISANMLKSKRQLNICSNFKYDIIISSSSFFFELSVSIRLDLSIDSSFFRFMLAIEIVGAQIKIKKNVERN